MCFFVEALATKNSLPIPRQPHAAYSVVFERMRFNLIGHCVALSLAGSLASKGAINDNGKLIVMGKVPLESTKVPIDKLAFVSFNPSLVRDVLGLG